MELVQAVLLYGSETWVTKPNIGSFLWIPPQGGPQADRTATSEGEGQDVGAFTTGGSDGGVGVIGGGYLRLPSP